MAHQTQIQFYRGAEADIPTLAAGEPGFTTDTFKLFIGDGATNHEIGGATLADGDYGDVTVSSSGTVITIDAGVVTYAKMQDVSATSRVLGRKTAGAGDTEECTLSEVLDFVGSAAQGDILYRGAATWTRLGAGTSGHFLKTQGAGANPTWAAATATLGDGDYGDVTVSSTGTVITIDNDAVTYAKIQDVSATDRVLGRVTAGSGVIEEITFTDQAQQLCDDTSFSAMRTTLGAAASGANTDITSIQLGYGGLKILSNGTSYYLTINCEEAFSADRTLSLHLGDASRSLTIGASASVSGSNTGDQTISLGGDLNGSGTTGITATINSGAVTLAKMADLATDRLIGRDTAGTGVPEALTVGGGIEFTGSGGIQVVAASDSVAGKIEIAVQSEMESASSTTLAVTPGRVNFHPGVAKWWVNFNGTGTVAIRSSHNVTSITDNGTGDYTVNIATDFSSADWSGWALGSASTQEIGGALAAGTFPIRFRDSSFTLVDSTYVLAGGFGDQA